MTVVTAHDIETWTAMKLIPNDMAIHIFLMISKLESWNSLIYGNDDKNKIVILQSYIGILQKQTLQIHEISQFGK